MDWYGASLAGLIGLCVGSFAAVLLDRVPRGQSVIAPRSRCSSCHRGLSASELLPVVSFLWLRGRCRTCKARIPLRDPVMEVSGSGLAVAAFLIFGWTGLGACLSAMTLGALSAGYFRRHKASEAGYTLVEAVLAMALLALVLVSYGGMYARNIRIESTARTRLIMLNLVRERLDILQSWVAADHNPDSNPNFELGPWSGWTCASGSGDLEWRQKVVIWNGTSTNLYQAIVEVRNLPCGATPDPASPPRTERGWAIVRYN